MQQSSFDFGFPEKRNTVSAGSTEPSQRDPAAAMRRDIPRRNISDIHLAAARKLSKEIRRADYYSPEATRTGRLLCRHLLAMLQDTKLPDKALQNEYRKEKISQATSLQQAQ